MKFFRSGVVYAAGNVASAAVPFLLLPLLTRFLSPADYGEVVTFALLVSLCQTVAGLHVHGAVGIAWFQRPHTELSSFIASAVAVALVSTLTVMLLVAAVFTLAPQIGGIGAQWTIVAALTAGSNVVLQCRLVLWQSQHRALASAALQFGASALNVGLSLLAVLAFGLGGDGRNAAIAAATFLMAVVAVALFISAKELRWAANADHCRDLLRFGAPLIVHSLAGVLLSTADRWSVSVRLDAAALGVYGAGAQLGMVMPILADAFVKAYSPWVYARLRSGTAGENHLVVGLIYVAMLTFVALAVLVGLVLHFGARSLFGPQFQAAAGVLPWFMVGGAACGIYMCTSPLFFFYGRTSRLASMTLSSAVIGIPVTWWLVGYFGAMGAAAGFAATQGLLALLTTAASVRTFALPWSEVTLALAAWRQTIFPLRPTSSTSKRKV